MAAFSISFASATGYREGGTIQFTISWDGATSAITKLKWSIVFSGSLPTSSNDFPSGGTTGTVTIQTQTAAGMMDFTLNVEDDGNAEPIEDLVVRIEPASDNANAAATIGTAEASTKLADNDLLNGATSTPPYYPYVLASRDFPYLLVGDTLANTFALGQTQTGSIEGYRGNDQYIITRYQTANVEIIDTDGTDVVRFDFGVVISSVETGGGIFSSEGLITLDNGSVITIGSPTRWMFQLGEADVIGWTAFNNAIASETTVLSYLSSDTLGSGSPLSALYVGTGDREDVYTFGEESDASVEGFDATDTYIITRFQSGDLELIDGANNDLLKFDVGVVISSVSTGGGIFSSEGLIDLDNNDARITIGNPSLWTFQLGDDEVIGWEAFKNQAENGYTVPLGVGLRSTGSGAMLVEDSRLEGSDSAEGRVIVRGDGTGYSLSVQRTTGTTPGTDTAISTTSTTTIAGVYGTLHVIGEGRWHYILDNADTDTDGLNSGQTGSETFIFTYSKTGEDDLTETVEIEIAGRTDVSTSTTSHLSDFTSRTDDLVIRNLGVTLSVIIRSGSGDDIIFLGDGSTRSAEMRAGDGHDEIHGDDGDDQVLDGEGGNDILYGYGGNDRLDGGSGHDTFYGGRGTDTIVGEAGDDIIVLDNAPDVTSADHDLVFFSRGGTNGRDKVRVFVPTAPATINELETMLNLRFDNIQSKSTNILDLLIYDRKGTDGTSDDVMLMVWVDIGTVEPTLDDFDIVTGYYAVRVFGDHASGQLGSGGSGYSLSVARTTGATATNPYGLPVAITTSARTAVVGTYGTLYVEMDGDWQYEINNEHTEIAALLPTQTRVETFRFSYTKSGSADIDTPLTITIRGSEPLISEGADDQMVIEDHPLERSAEGREGIRATGYTLTVTRTTGTPDGAAVTIATSGITQVAGTYGTLHVGAGGQWEYILDNADTDTEALASGTTVTETFSFVHRQGASSLTATISISIEGRTDMTVTTRTPPSYESSTDNLVIHNTNGYIFDDGMTAEGTTRIETGSGNDIIFAGTSEANRDNRESIDAGGGHDLVYGGGGRDNIVGGDGNDVLYAGSGNRDSLRGNGGNDELHGGSGFDMLQGDAGDDIFILNTAQGLTSADYDQVEDWSRSGAEGRDKIRVFLPRHDDPASVTLAHIVADLNLRFAAFLRPGEGNEYELNIYDTKGTADEADDVLLMQLENVGGSATNPYTLTRADFDVQTGHFALLALSTQALTGQFATARTGYSLSVTRTTGPDGVATSITSTDAASPDTVAGTYGTFSITADGSWRYVLNNANRLVANLGLDETLVETFALRYQQAGEENIDTIITITINGRAIFIDTGDAAIVVEDSIDFNEAEGRLGLREGLTNYALSITPTTGATEGSATNIVGTTNTQITGTYGTLHVNERGAWRYVLNNEDADTQALSAGDRVVESYRFTYSRGSESFSNVVRINIDGLDDITPDTLVSSYVFDIPQIIPLDNNGNPQIPRFNERIAIRSVVHIKDATGDNADDNTDYFVLAGGAVSNVEIASAGTLRFQVDIAAGHIILADGTALSFAAADDLRVTVALTITSVNLVILETTAGNNMWTAALRTDAQLATLETAGTDYYLLGAVRPVSIPGSTGEFIPNMVSAHTSNTGALLLASGGAVSDFTANSITTETKASHTFGSDDVTMVITAKLNGGSGNNIQIKFDYSATAQSPSIKSITGIGANADPYIITVTVNGASNTPGRLQNVVNAINNHAEASMYVEAALGDGTSTGEAGPVSLYRDATLSGGASLSHRIDVAGGTLTLGDGTQATFAAVNDLQVGIGWSVIIAETTAGNNMWAVQTATTTDLAAMQAAGTAYYLLGRATQTEYTQQTLPLSNVKGIAYTTDIDGDENKSGDNAASYKLIGGAVSDIQKFGTTHHTIDIAHGVLLTSHDGIIPIAAVDNLRINAGEKLIVVQLHGVWTVRAARTTFDGPNRLANEVTALMDEDDLNFYILGSINNENAFAPNTVKPRETSTNVETSNTYITRTTIRLHGDQDVIVLGREAGTEHIDEIIYGGKEADEIWAGGGHDIIYGETDTDRLRGEAGHDIIYGGAGSDIIYGGSGNDILYGQAGSDTLYGGFGRDILTGSDPNTEHDLGADFFVLNIAPTLTDADVDIVTDFDRSSTLVERHDKILIFAPLDTAPTTLAALQSTLRLRFENVAADGYGTAARDLLIYNTRGVLLMVLQDVGGTEDTPFALTLADFEVRPAGLVVPLRAHTLFDAGGRFGTIATGTQLSIVRTTNNAETAAQPVVSGAAIAGVYGTLRVEANGRWTYQINDGPIGSNTGAESAAVRALEADAVFTETFDVSYTQNDVDFTRTIAISIQGRPTLIHESGAMVLSAAMDTGGVRTVMAAGNVNTDTTTTGGSGDDVLVGNANNNRLEGGAGDDILHGLDGDDILQGGSGSDILLGSFGTDTATWQDHVTTNIVVNLADPTKWRFDIYQQAWVSGTSANHLYYRAWIDVDGDGIRENSDEFDYLVNIQNLLGGARHDRLTGDDNVNTLQGLAGADILDGRGGGDRLFGGSGNDWLYPGPATGGADVDILTGGAGDDVFVPDLTASSDNQIDVVTDFGTGTDRIFAAPIRIAKTLAELREMLDWSWSIAAYPAHTMNNGPAMETIIRVGDATSQRALVLIDHDDPLTLDDFFQHSGASSVTFKEGSGLRITGQIQVSPPLWGFQAPTVASAAGTPRSAPFVSAPSLSATLSGAYGTLAYDASGAWEYTLNADAPALATHTQDRAPLTESFTFTWTTAARALLVSKTLTINIEGRASTTAAQEVNELRGDSSDSIITITGTSNNVVRTEAGSGDNIIIANNYDNTLSGHGGDDELYGGTGSDNLIGGPGNDILDGGGGDNPDRALWSGTAGVTVNLVDPVRWRYNAGTQSWESGTDPNAYPYIRAWVDLNTNGELESTDEFDYLRTDIGGDRHALSTIERLTGGNGNDRFTGSYEDDNMVGRGGNDILRGSGGNDRLEGGGGNDRLEGGEGFDTIISGSDRDIIVVRLQPKEAGDLDSVTDFSGIDMIEFRGKYAAPAGSTAVYTAANIRYDGSMDYSAIPGIPSTTTGFNSVGTNDIVIWHTRGTTDTSDDDMILVLEDYTGNFTNVRASFVAIVSEGRVSARTADGRATFGTGHTGLTVTLATDGATSPTPVTIGTGTTNVHGRYGTLRVNRDTTWTYILDGEETGYHDDVVALDGGEELTEKFTFQRTGGGGTDPITVSIIIEGKTDVTVAPSDPSFITSIYTIEGMFIRLTDDDSLPFRTGLRYIAGDAGDDLIYGASGNERIDGRRGYDELYGLGGDDTILGFEGDDYIDGGDGNDILSGGKGHDTINAGTGSNLLVGDAGNDIFIVQDWVGNNDFNVIRDFQSGDKISIPIRGGATNLNQLYERGNLRVTTNSDFDGYSAFDRPRADTSANDTIIYDRRGTSGNGDDRVILVLADYTTALTFADFTVRNGGAHIAPSGNVRVRHVIREDSPLTAEASGHAINTDPSFVNLNAAQTGHQLDPNIARTTSEKSIAGQWGTFYFKGSGEWRYVPNSNLNVNDGSQLADTFRLQFSQAHGVGTRHSRHDITIVIDGRTETTMSITSTTDLSTSTGDLIISLSGHGSNLRTGSGDDVITGNAGSQLIRGGPGDDEIYGRGGASFSGGILYGGTGNNILVGGGSGLTQDAVSWEDLADDGTALNSHITHPVNLIVSDNVKWKYDTTTQSWESGTDDSYTFHRAWRDVNANGIEDAGDEYDYIKGVDDYRGGAGNDRFDLSGTTERLSVVSGDGDDIIIDGDNVGRSSLQTDAGNDIISGGGGQDHILGGTGDDIFILNQNAASQDDSDMIMDFRTHHAPSAPEEFTADLGNDKIRVEITHAVATVAALESAANIRFQQDLDYRDDPVMTANPNDDDSVVVAATGFNDDDIDDTIIWHTRGTATTTDDFLLMVLDDWTETLTLDHFDLILV